MSAAPKGKEKKNNIMKLSRKLLHNYFYHLIWCTRLEACSLHTTLLPQTQEEPERPWNRRDVHYHLFHVAAATEALENSPSVIFANACLPRY